MEIKRMIDLVRVKRDMLQYVQDVRVVRGMGQGLSDHVALCKVRILGAWIKRAAWKEVLAASNEDAKERCMEAYREEKS